MADSAAYGSGPTAVHLVHELGELAGAEELLDGGDDGPDVDERPAGVIASTSCVVIRSRTTRSMRDRPNPYLVLDQLAHRADPAIGEVVLVVDPVAGFARGEMQEVGAAARISLRDSTD